MMFASKSLVQVLPGLLLPAFFTGALSRPTSPVSLSQRQFTPANPIDNGWYADPDASNFNGTFWVYTTVSIAFDDQGWFDAFSSEDLITWTKHERVFAAGVNSEWAVDSLWAPCTIKRNGKYYFYYTANNPVAKEGIFGIGVAVADTPAGPFTDIVNEPIVGTHINGADPMDQQVFIDDDDQWYLIWGGSAINIAPLEEDMKTLGTWTDGSAVVEITPNKGFGEGTFMLKHNGTYYLMWSEGGYGTPDYRVAYAMSDSLTGPFERIGLILSKDTVVADGPGHHSIFKDGDQYYIAYHRRILGDDVADHRIVAVDRFYFNEDGTIRPVVMT